MMRLVLPRMLNRTSTLDVLASEQRFRIDWSTTVAAVQVSEPQRAATDEVLNTPLTARLAR